MKQSIKMENADFIAKMMNGKVINGGGDVILIEIPCPNDEDLTLILTAGGWALEHYMQGSVYEPSDIDGKYED